MFSAIALVSAVLSLLKEIMAKTIKVHPSCNKSSYALSIYCTVAIYSNSFTAITYMTCAMEVL